MESCTVPRVSGTVFLVLVKELQPGDLAFRRNRGPATIGKIIWKSKEQKTAIITFVDLMTGEEYKENRLWKAKERTLQGQIGEDAKGRIKDGKTAIGFQPKQEGKAKGLSRFRMP